MAWLFRRAKFAWGLVFLGGDVWTLVRWIEPEGLSMSLSLGAPEYAALMTLFTGGLCALVWSWCQPYRPSKQFAGLYQDISNCRNAARDIMNSRGTMRETRGTAMFSHVTELDLQLRKLGVNTPQEKPDSNRYSVVWYNFLVHAASYSRSADLSGFKQGNEALLTMLSEMRIE